MLLMLMVRNIKFDLEEVFRLRLKCDFASDDFSLEKEGSCQVNVNISSSLPREVMYDNHLSRVLFSLVSNALKFTTPV